MPVEKRGDLNVRILYKRVHTFEMKHLNDGVDDSDEPDLDYGKDIVEEESDDVAWMCDKYKEDVDPSSLW